MRCMKCGRKLTREPIEGMGPVCARAMLGAKLRQVKREDRRSGDERQADFFAEDLAMANRVEALLSGISLEMPA